MPTSQTPSRSGSSADRRPLSQPSEGSDARRAANRSGKPKKTRRHGEETSATLLDRIRSSERDELAWARVWKLYSGVVYDWSRGRGLQDADAANIVQDVMRNVARSVHKFEPQGQSGAFRAWLWTITVNEINRQHGKNKKLPRGMGGTDANAIIHTVADPHAVDPLSDSLVMEGLDSRCEIPPEPDPGSTNVKLMRQALKMIRPDFGDKVWQAFERSAIGGEAAADIGRDLGMKDGAVRQAKYRVIAKLKKFFDGIEDFDLGEDPKPCD